MQVCTYQCALQVAVGNCQEARHCLLRQRFRFGFKWHAQALATATDVHTSAVALIGGHMAC